MTSGKEQILYYRKTGNRKHQKNRLTTTYSVKDGTVKVEAQKKETITVVNRYGTTPPPPAPKTGDESNPGGMLALMLGALSVMFSAAFTRRRYRVK